MVVLPSDRFSSGAVVVRLAAGGAAGFPAAHDGHRGDPATALPPVPLLNSTS
jgi:hypothetical protein